MPKNSHLYLFSYKEDKTTDFFVFRPFNREGYNGVELENMGFHSIFDGVNLNIRRKIFWFQIVFIKENYDAFPKPNAKTPSQAKMGTKTLRWNSR